MGEVITAITSPIGFSFGCTAGCTAARMGEARAA